MKFKELPEDFIVEEKIKLTFTEKGKYQYLKMTKQNRNTLDVIKEIAKQGHTKEVGFAGLKDKQAITTQYISLPTFIKQLPSIENVTLKKVGEGNEPIRLGDLEGNYFIIDVKEQIPHITVSYLENYFGDQRFGTDNVAWGKQIIKRTLTNNTSIPKPILRLYIHAYQSFLWNTVAAHYIKNHFTNAKENNGLYFTDKENSSITIPLLAFDTEWYDKEIESLYAEIMEKEGITQEDFITRQFPALLPKTKERALFVPVKNFTQKKTTLSFFLPKGSYATILLKKVETLLK